VRARQAPVEKTAILPRPRPSPVPPWRQYRRGQYPRQCDRALRRRARRIASV